MSKQSRLDTMRVITGQHHIMTNSSKLTAIYGEFNLIALVERSTNDNKWLLTVLYATRALDTCLREIITYMGWPVQGNQRGLGAYFATLATHHVLTGNQNSDFKRTLANKRNKYLHEAGATPEKLEANRILNEMHDCLATVLQKT
jgi:hypothetical protein